MNCLTSTALGLLVANFVWVLPLTAKPLTNFLLDGEQSLLGTDDPTHQSTAHCTAHCSVSWHRAFDNAQRFDPNQTAWQMDGRMTFSESHLAEILSTTIANLPEPNSAGINRENGLGSQVLQVVRVLTGIASWYGPGFHGNRSASGEIFDQNALTAAHPSLPFGTNVRVTNRKNNKSVVVRINDRGPFVGNRVIDVSRAAAQRIGLVASGVAPVKLEVLAKPQ